MFDSCVFGKMVGYGVFAMPKDQDVLDIVTDLNRDLRHNAEFCALLRECDEADARRVTQSYLQWLYKALETDKEPH